jgi:hypothetical protein
MSLVFRGNPKLLAKKHTFKVRYGKYLIAFSEALNSFQKFILPKALALANLNA